MSDAARMTPPADSSRRSRRAWIDWGPLLLLPVAVLLLLPSEWPRWALMWSLALAIYAGCKWLSWRHAPPGIAPAWKHAAYLLAWPGMDARAFLNPRPASAFRAPTGREWAWSLAMTAAGLAMVFGVVRLVAGASPYLAGWTGMIGMVMTLHFGAFQALSCCWRAAGIPAQPVMQRPLASSGVSEFWGRRWNTAFRDLAHRFLFRPMSPWLGPQLAILAGFLVSGLVHELVISVPAGAGYGGPTAYFLVQAVAIFVERSRTGQRLGLGEGWIGWAFMAMVLILPLFVLFHPPFIRVVILPFLQAIGAL